jgi:RNA polymerase sigma factor (TIGR02999 family)
MEELTQLLNRARNGDARAQSSATALIYADLKRIAAAELRRGGRNGTLNTTAVVHEAYAKLAGYEGGPLADRQHYFRLAARAMRQVVIDHARARLAEKRGGDVAHVELEAAQDIAMDRAQELVDLDEALAKLAETEPRAAQVVEWHVFGGMTFDEIAAALEVSERTARGDWAYARALLADSLASRGED